MLLASLLRRGDWFHWMHFSIIQDVRCVDLSGFRPMLTFLGWRSWQSRLSKLSFWFRRWRRSTQPTFAFPKVAFWGPTRSSLSRGGPEAWQPSHACFMRMRCQMHSRPGSWRVRSVTPSSLSLLSSIVTFQEPLYLIHVTFEPTCPLYCLCKTWPDELRKLLG